MMQLRTLFDCRNHWQWLWITGSSRKLSYKPSNNWIARCACCQHIVALHPLAPSCKNCLLAWYAWSDHCLSSKDSLYRKWRKAKTKKTRIKYAHKMVMACNLAIENELTK